MLRKELFNSWWTGKQEDEASVTKEQHKRVKGLLALGYTVVVSDTNLPDKSIKTWMEIAHHAGADFAVQDFRHVPLEVVLQRNSRFEREAAGKRLDQAIIRDKWERFIKGRDLSKTVEWTPKPETGIEPYVQPEYVWNDAAVIVDIDNTLAIMGDRSPYDGEKVHIDTLNEDVATAVDNYRDNSYKVYIVSGRDSKYREVTERWLASKNVKYDMLLMRPEGDNREDSIIKYELFNQHIRPLGELIVGVYDDRHRVLRMWRKLGLTTFHVNGPDAGDF
jgi:hypothetical protein